MTELPTTFGKYYLTEKLAVGGMAEIYLAKLIGPGGFEKQLIIKQIHPELSDESQFVDLFVTEAKTLVGLSHGNIVPIYELGVVDDRYFIAMEYIDGPTLSELVRAVGDAGARIEPPVAAYIAAELVKGLDYAHRKGDGVIHRDLSPRNVMISREGEVKLVDFGIAIELDQQAVITKKGRPEGSYPYMSPEQVRREPLTAQSDLFSAGVLLWESLTGHSLFARDDADETLEAVLSAEIPAPSAEVPDAGIPAELDAICARALSRDVGDRFASAGQMLTQLNRYLYSQEAPVGPAVLSRLVARHCPPVVRPARDDGEATPARDRVEDGADDGADRTVPIQRTPAKGKRRAGTQTFATSVEFEKDVLANATPLFPIQAIRDVETAVATPSRGRVETDDAEPEAAVDVAPADDAEPAPPARTGWLIGGAALIGAVVVGVLLLRGGAAAEGPADAMPPPDAAALAAVADASPPPPDATPPDAGPPDARPAVKRRPDAAPAVRGTATLKVGANPWGDVYLDGNKLGRAPGEWTVPAGRHKVEVKFPVPGREQSEQFRIDLRAGDTRNLGVVDFTD